MEPRFVDTKVGLAVSWAVYGVIFGTVLAVLMGETLSDAVFFGVAMGGGFAIGVSLFFKPE